MAGGLPGAAAELAQFEDALEVVRRAVGVAGRVQSGRVAHRADDVGGHDDDQLGLRALEAVRAEQRAEDRDVTQAGGGLGDLRGLVRQQAGDGEALAGAEFDGGVGAAHGEGRDADGHVGVEHRGDAVRLVELADFRADVQADSAGRDHGGHEGQADAVLLEVDRDGVVAGGDRDGELAADQEAGRLAAHGDQVGLRQHVDQLVLAERVDDGGEVAAEGDGGLAGPDPGCGSERVVGEDAAAAGHAGALLDAEDHRLAELLAAGHPVHAQLAHQGAGHLGDTDVQADLDRLVDHQVVLHLAVRRQGGLGRGHRAAGIGRGGDVAGERHAGLRRAGGDGRLAGMRDGAAGLGHVVAGGHDGDLVLGDRLPGGGECRDRGGPRGHAEDEQAGGTGGAHLGHLGVGGEHVGSVSLQVDHLAAAGRDGEAGTHRVYRAGGLYCRQCGRFGRLLVGGLGVRRKGLGMGRGPGGERGGGQGRECRGRQQAGGNPCRQARLGARLGALLGAQFRCGTHQKWYSLSLGPS